MASLFDSYQYTPLQGDEIRILQLHPGTFEEDLHVSIVHADLEALPTEFDKTEVPASYVREALPSGWDAHRTPEGRWWFYDNSLDDLASDITYVHPVAEVQERLDRCSKSNGVRAQPLYEALSYVWGSSTLEGHIYVSESGADAGRRQMTVMQITRNLDEALRYLRNAYQPRTLWVDAICINQASVSERSTQVKRMSEIYRLAWRTVIWLGAESNDSTSALQLLQYLGSQVEISEDGFNVHTPNAAQPMWSEPSCPLPYTEAEWQSIIALLERPWFDRLWVVQEAALSNEQADVLVGSTRIRYFFFRRAIAALNYKRGVPLLVSNLVNIGCGPAYGFSSNSIVQLLNISRERKCTDGHDRVHAVLGFCGPRFRTSIEPSYARAVYDTYKDAFITYSRMTGRLDLLAIAIRQIPSQELLPGCWTGARPGLK